MPEGVKRGRGVDVGNTQHGQEGEGEGHAIESVERESGEAGEERNELRRSKNRFGRK
jgi:hypothetical protein